MTQVWKIVSAVQRAQLSGFCKLNESSKSWFNITKRSLSLWQKEQLNQITPRVASTCTCSTTMLTYNSNNRLLYNRTTDLSSSYPTVPCRFSSNDSSDIHELRARFYSTSSDDSSEGTANLSIFQRFKRAYKEHGKVLIGVHLVTSTFWFGSFYTAAAYGFDIIPFLEQLGAGETILKPFKTSGLGNIALAYLMYKVATPVRYTVTLGGTNLVIRYFKRTGKINVREEDSLRNLYEDSKSKLQENKDKLNTIRKERINEYIKAAREKRKQLKR